MKYEYCMKVVHIDHVFEDDDDKCTEELKRMAELGWEFVTATFNTQMEEHCLYFKKEAKS